jgi:hypothetical protein
VARGGEAEGIFPLSVLCHGNSIAPYEKKNKQLIWENASRRYLSRILYDTERCKNYDME